MTASNRQTFLVWLTVAALALFSAGLSLGRIYQVDEAQNLYMARVAVRSEVSEFFTTAAIHLLPLGWLTQSLSTSVAVFTAARLLFLGVFWLNILLLARAAGPRIGSSSGAWITLGAATLAPLWDYGIEVRHDNLLLSGVLVIWLVGRSTRAHGAWRFWCIGVLTAVLQFVAMKAVLYTAPISLLTLMLSPSSPARPRWRSSVAWILGVASGLACVRMLYAITGLWHVYLDAYRGLARVERTSSTTHAFALEQFITESPMLVAATVASLLYLLHRTVRRRASFSSEGMAEAMLLFVAVCAFAANPAPFPYNLVLLAPFAYLFVVRVLLGSLEPFRSPRRALVWIAGLVIVIHCTAFARASARHLAWDNSRQQALMTLAESLTDPARDRVYDASGLVVARRSNQRWWYLHSLNMPAYGTAEFPRLAEALALRPAVVIIRSYRTDWLSADDAQFITSHYVPIADDLWVLGTATSGRSSWNCLQAGRYWLHSAGTAAELPEVRVDGVAVPPGILTLTTGRHELLVHGSGNAALVWIGPRLQTPPTLAQRSHELVFVNWY